MNNLINKIDENYKKTKKYIEFAYPEEVFIRKHYSYSIEQDNIEHIKLNIQFNFDSFYKDELVSSKHMLKLVLYTFFEYHMNEILEKLSKNGKIQLLYHKNNTDLSSNYIARFSERFTANEELIEKLLKQFFDQKETNKFISNNNASITILNNIINNRHLIAHQGLYKLQNLSTQPPSIKNINQELDRLKELLVEICNKCF